MEEAHPGPAPEAVLGMLDGGAADRQPLLRRANVLAGGEGRGAAGELLAEGGGALSVNVTNEGMEDGRCRPPQPDIDAGGFSAVRWQHCRGGGGGNRPWHSTFNFAVDTLTHSRRQ